MVEDLGAREGRDHLVRLVLVQFGLRNQRLDVLVGNRLRELGRPKGIGEFLGHDAELHPRASQAVFQKLPVAFGIAKLGEGNTDGRRKALVDAVCYGLADRKPLIPQFGKLGQQIHTLLLQGRQFLTDLVPHPALGQQIVAVFFQLRPFFGLALRLPVLFDQGAKGQLLFLVSGQESSGFDGDCLLGLDNPLFCLG